MQLKAVLLCEDVRIEVDGTLTLIGVYNERLIAPPGNGPIEIPRLAVLAVIRQLTGIQRIGVRHRIRQVDDTRLAEHPLAYEPHDPAADEHNFVFAHAPMRFAEPGAHELVLDLETEQLAVTHRYRFILQRRV
jgi:hypothetical protein